MKKREKISFIFLIFTVVLFLLIIGFLFNNFVNYIQMSPVKEGEGLFSLLGKFPESVIYLFKLELGILSICNNNTDCGTDGYVGDNYCMYNYIMRNYTSFTCNFPGFPGYENSYCSNSTYSQGTQWCSSGCVNGSCCTAKTCSELGKTCGTWDNGCGGNLSCGYCSFQQTCNSSGQCSNFLCNNNAECGTDGYVGNNFCTGKNITKNYINFTCNNPGQQNSYCLNITGIGLIESCSFDCVNASCCTAKTCSELGKTCGTWSDECGGTVTCPSCPLNQVCNLFGQCSNFLCNNNADCGTDEFFGNNFCTGKNVTKNYINFTCDYPGQQNSYCSNSTGMGLIENCSYNCNNGLCCIPKTCSELGKTCGSWSDECGGTLNCGECCTPLTCSYIGKTCGIWGDNCNGIIDCGICCTPKTCSQLGKTCGTWDNECGVYIVCGGICSTNPRTSEGGGGGNNNEVTTIGNKNNNVKGKTSSNLSEKITEIPKNISGTKGNTIFELFKKYGLYFILFFLLIAFLLIIFFIIKRKKKSKNKYKIKVKKS